MRTVRRLLGAVLVAGALALPVVPLVPAGAAVPLPHWSVVVLRQGQSFRTGQVFRWRGWQLRLAGGVLILTKPNGDIQWYTDTQSSRATRLTLQRDGNLVLYTASNKPVWWTRTNGLGLTHGALRLFWNSTMGRCERGDPGGLELSGVVPGGYPSHVWTSCALTTMLPNSALSSWSYGLGGMSSPNGRNQFWYRIDGELEVVHYNDAGPPISVQWQLHATDRPTLLFGFNPERDGPALYDGSPEPVWTEHGITVSGLPYRWFAMQDDGNFVLYASSDRARTKNIRAIWSTDSASPYL